MWPSSASRAIAPTVIATASRFAQPPRPNRLTAAKPTATRRAVTLLGVHSKRVDSDVTGSTCMRARLPSARSGHGNLPANTTAHKSFAINRLQRAGKLAPTWRARETLHLSAVRLSLAPVPFRAFVRLTFGLVLCLHSRMLFQAHDCHAVSYCVMRRKEPG